MSETQGIKLDEKTKQRLKALGEKRDRSSHWLMKAAIERYLEEEEEVERQKQEEMAEWEDYQLTGEAIPNSRVIDWLSRLAEGKRVSWNEWFGEHEIDWTLKNYTIFCLRSLLRLRNEQRSLF